LRRIDGVYLTVKRVLAKPQVRKGIKWSSVIAVIIALFLGLSSVLVLQSPQFTTTKISFHLDEKPTFEIQLPGKKFPLVKKTHAEEINQDVALPKDSDGQTIEFNDQEIKVIVKDNAGTVTETASKIERVSDDRIKVILGEDNQKEIKPGKYTLDIEVKNSAKTYNLEQDFTWGVLAINTDRSVYEPEEEAFIGMAVLNDFGNMVCDAKVNLEITDPSGNTTNLSTDNHDVTVSKECRLKGVTNSPDYFATYQTKNSGTYVMKLKAETTNGAREIEDRFYVEENPDFVIKREGPTRIFPPDFYKMKLTVKANSAFSGEVREFVPDSFEIKPQDGLKVEGKDKIKTLTWTPNLQAGEITNLEYEFKAPNISPQFYILGPLKFVDTDKGKTLFEEKRSWQIAADAVCTASVSGNWSDGATWGGTCGANSYPGATASGDTVTINSGITVTLDVTPTYSVGVITFNDPVNSSNAINFSGSPTLHTTGTLNLTASTGTGTSTFAVGTGHFIADSSITIGGGTSADSAVTLSTGMVDSSGVSFSGTAAHAKFTFTDAGTLYLSGDFGNGGTLTGSTGTITFSATCQMGAYTTYNNIHVYNGKYGETVTTTGTTTIGGNLDIESGGHLTNNANLTVPTSITGAGEFTNGATGTLNFGGSSIGVTTFTASASGNTVNYNGAAQTVKATATYHHLTLSGSGTKTLTTTTTAINGNLTLSGTASTSTVVNLTIGGDLTLGTGTAFTAAAGYTVGVTGNVAITSTGTLTNNSAGGFTIATNLTGTGTLTQGNNAILNLGGTATITTLNASASGNTINYNGAAQTVNATATYHHLTLSGTSAKTLTTTTTAINGNLTLSGTASTSTVVNLTIGGDLTLGTGTAFTAAAGYTVGVTGNVAITSTGTLTNNSAGGFTIATNLTGTGTLTQGNNAILNLGGTATITTLNASASGNTINYNGAAQTVNATATYHHLTLSGTSAKTLTTTTTAINGDLTLSGTASTATVVGLAIGGNLSVGAGTTFTAAGFALTVTGTTTVTGASSNLVINNATGTKIFTGLVTIDTSATWNNSGNSAITMRGGLTFNGTAFTAGSGVYTFDTTAAQALSGTSLLTISSVTVTSPTVLTNNISFTVSTALDGTGEFINSTKKIFSFKGSTLDITTLTTTAGGNTVTYSSTAVNQTIRATTYYNLTLIKSTRTATLGGDIIINGSLNVSSGILAGTDDITVKGSVTGTGTITLTAGTFLERVSTNLTFGSNIGANNWTFNNLDLENSSASNDCTITTRSNASGGKIIVNGTLTVGNATDTKTTTLQNETNDRVLDIANLSITSKGLLTASSTAAFTVSDAWANAGTFTPGTGTVTFDSTNASAISGNNTFNNLTMDTSVDGAKTITFTAGTTQAISAGGTWTINGGSGKVLTLQSSTPTSAWNFNISAPMTSGDYIAVQDSYSANTNKITPGANVTNNGNNDGWIFNQPPYSPTDLAQKKVTGGATLNVGDWTNETQVQFTATASDPDNPDTLYLCVETKPINTAFDGTESCGTGVPYSGTPVTVTSTISSQTDETEYHWRTRVKDAAGSYSSWVAYGNNPSGDGTTDGNPANRDYGIDTVLPTGGTVYDGTEIGVENFYNDGSLTALSANWTGFNASISGLNKYQYAIGTTQGGTDIKSWTDNSTTSSVTSTSLNLHTSQLYYFSVRAVNNAGSTQATPTYSSGQMVLPTLSFVLSANVITFDTLTNINDYQSQKNLTITTSTNASSGYKTKAYKTQLLTSLAYPTVTIPDFENGTWNSPGSWPAGQCTLGSDCGFGVTSSDPLVEGSNRFQPSGGYGTKYCPFTNNIPGDTLADNPGPITGGGSGPILNEAFTITSGVAAPTTQAASEYKAYVIFVSTANY